MSQPNTNWIEMDVPFKAVGGGRFHRTKIELTFQDTGEDITGWESTKKNGKLFFYSFNYLGHTVNGR